MRIHILIMVVIAAIAAVRPGMAAEPAVSKPTSNLAADVKSRGNDLTRRTDNSLSGNGCGANNCGCTTACLPCLAECCEDPLIVGRVNWLYMWRNRPESVDVFYNPSDVALLNASDFSFGATSGIDASLTISTPRFRWCDGVDLRYLWLDDFNAYAAFAVPAGNNHLNTTPQSFFVGPLTEPAVFQYQSKLQTLEVNIRRHFSLFDGLLGFRYADFHEKLHGVYHFLDLTETETWGINYNDMYGLQIGADVLFWESPRGLRIDGFGKAGIYYNDIHTQFNTDFFYAPGPYSDAKLSKAAFLGELGLNAAYQINDHLALRGGYQLMWVSGVTSAADQVPATGNFNTTGRIDSHVDAHANVFYQGVNAGLEVTW